MVRIDANRTTMVLEKTFNYPLTEAERQWLFDAVSEIATGQFIPGI